MGRFACCHSGLALISLDHLLEADARPEPAAAFHMRYHQYHYGFIGATLIALLVSCGCAVTREVPDSQAVAAVDVPDRFVSDSPAADMQLSPDESCRNPMYDPRDGSEVRLLRSSNGRGDYEVPNGRYGTGPDQLLRLECGTGRPIGIVPR